MMIITHEKRALNEIDGHLFIRDEKEKRWMDGLMQAYILPLFYLFSSLTPSRENEHGILFNLSFASTNLCIFVFQP